MSVLDRHLVGAAAGTEPRLSIAMVGTRGVPAHYGGFETCVEEVGARLVERGHDVVVYCRRASDDDDGDRLSEYRGMRLVHLPALRSRTLETLSHTGASVAHLVRRPTDVALVFNAANAPYLPVIKARGIPVATHVDGLEWKRAKWGPVGQRYYRQAEALAVRFSDALIADAVGIQDYYTERFGVPTTLISYGAPRVQGDGDPARLAELGLTPGGYHLVVARFEPENHVDVIVEGYSASSASKPLVVVGSAPYSDAYTSRVRSLADDRVRFLGGVWDQDLLDQLYAGAHTYLHGHSVGGTNPSLLRAIGARAAVSAFDVSFNREVLEEAGRYWTTPADVRAVVEASEADPEGTLSRALASGMRADLYDWDLVADGYESLCFQLASLRSKAGARV
ncbi:Glycosyltransferase involved in cell wall bisynthesis [Quadrisphaera granulorum]|uniref:Glycosyltransferase involved in cell wall biosynthesis n=1 Tax=Quadrisphaera granulorum TaxID=317664 RepID=A0A316AFK4_9ACTN|nr:DUF1972 domain-containing protein [Quadrisphaera granulorum]PWJ56038.1 glycosyltransferase involved in cell wall biosynthesis [Quadrisphaera granulorum]SZE94672.1 Glycosyltransferase involved in cell wall bisynthesis [Quadrisphaera granulorum]